MHQDTRHGRAFHPAAFSQTASLALQCPCATDRTRLAPRFIGLVEGFLTPLPAERPKQTPLFFIFPARRLAREGSLPNWSET
jgi:hypothetical protein